MFKGNSSGFTLIETLIVIFIISLLSVLILADYQSGKKEYTLLQANQKLISDIRKVQNMSINGIEIEGLCSTASACYGYGVYFNSASSYILFADKNNNRIYNDREGFETIDLPFPIIIQSTSPLSANVFFESPNPDTYINNRTDISATIILQIQGTTFTKRININTAGLIQNN